MATSSSIKTLNGYKITALDAIESITDNNGASTTVTYTKGDGTTATFTTKDTTYANVVANSATSGLMTGADKAKLDGIDASADVNQNAFSNVKVGTTTIAAASTTDTVEFEGTGLITVTPDATGKKVTISTTANNYSHPTSGVTAGTYKSVTVDAKGHVTSGSNPTTLSGYGITDAKIEAIASSGDKNVTLGSNTARVLTPDSSLAADKLTGTISIDRLPKGALERCVVVANDTARFALTEDSVQLGDTVKVTATNKMYFVVDASKLNSEDGYEVYTAGSATTVPWSGVTGHGTFAGAAVEGGSANSAAKLDSNAGSATNPVYFANGVPVACTHTLEQSVTASSKLTDTTYSAGTGLSLSGTTFNHSNSVTSATNVGNNTTTSLTYGGSFVVPKLSFDAQGHITAASGQTLTLPASDNTHYTTHLVTAASATATATGAQTANGVYLNLLDDTTIRDSHKIIGSGAATVKSDASGIITIDAVNTTYTAGTGLTLTGTQFSANAMKGASSTADGAVGIVPAPVAGDNAKFLRGDAKWASIALNITDDGNGNLTLGLVTQP